MARILTDSPVQLSEYSVLYQFLVARRHGPTRSHPEHGRETCQQRKYCVGDCVRR